MSPHTWHGRLPPTLLPRPCDRASTLKTETKSCHLVETHMLTFLSSRCTGLGFLIRILVQLTASDQQPTFFKAEGPARFQGCDSTVKLRRGVQYSITVTSWPAAHIVAAFLCGPELQDGEVELLLAPELVEEVGGAEPAGFGQTSCLWSCGLPLSAKSHRSRLWLRVVGEEFGSLALPLLVKVYPAQDKARTSGLRLRGIQYITSAHPEHGRQHILSSAVLNLP
ncbi:hypothetical protein V8C86DRAFT_2481443 [Haematococcus lacustris]